ncbi:hypothetical protein ND861_19215 [Leptospira sp. 2 VSF19]|uniref:Uncharacterized protein n=2 Tax=Leptospira soteropolitanensis TaxID=2950025 RepID=A0AAW5VHP9_9LEPT|nr:hypothetical protein [Leptospira soteropolitanensis]MCW7502275.1 hypothetical protein [Leptospira soteropolitanensis]MCW7528495.1 hypothetical protein [Leptospira soteropolitanensis]MCW7532359.1 hypothetical protein [Leptospira soteropolitanensis]
MKISTPLTYFLFCLFPISILNADKKELNLTQSLLLTLPFFSANMFVPPPGNEINGKYTFSRFQEANAKNYVSRQPFLVSANLAWIYGNHESPIYISEKPGNNLIFYYSTYCLGWSVGAIFCTSPNTELNFPNGEITQITYEITSISAIFLRLKVLFYGNNN